MSTPRPHRAGSVAILGRPNVGKSTLLNRIVGEKLSIVTPKPQTTRNRILGVWNAPDAQIAFIDTPGLHGARSGLNRYMEAEAIAAIDGADAGLLVVEATASAGGLPAAARRLDDSDRRILERLDAVGKRVVLALNKVDRLKDKPSLLPLLEAWGKDGRFAAMVPTSATRGKGIEGLCEELRALMPEGPPLYGPDVLTDRTERFLAAELVREQLFTRLRQELPYATAVIVEEWQERPEKGDVVVTATIFVERESQKAIVVGRRGAMIKEVGTAAREEISRLLGRRAHLKLEVKVVPDWTGSPETLDRAGYGAT